MTESTPLARRWLFAVTILGGSFLLFLVQPMVARMALPRLGGAPNVWNSAMLVYQALLLGGYAYAHSLSKLAISRQAAVHLVLLILAGLTLPIALPAISSPIPGREALWVPWLFVLTVGPVFFVLSAQAPLMQRWFAAHPSAGDPYPLYAASNLGSFVGLLAYPLLVEPFLPTDSQSNAWAIGYGLLILLVTATAFSRRSVGKAVASAEPPVTIVPVRGRTALWLVLSAVPSGLMLSTTTYLTTDIFAMPLLWVLPLGLYLLSFSIAFAARRRAANVLTVAAPVVLLAAGGIAMFASDEPSILAGAASLFMLFVVSVALHARLYATRPEPAQLTKFYMVMSAGGALGGVFCALLAPLLFDWTWEHPLLMLAAAALLPLRSWQRAASRFAMTGQRFRVSIAIVLFVVFMGGVWLNVQMASEPEFGALEIAVLVLLVAAGTLLAVRRWAYVAGCAFLLAAVGGITNALISFDGVRSRSYFGIYTVAETGPGQLGLYHGTTVHGVQYQDPQRATQPTTYYGRGSGAGRALLAAERLYGGGARIGVVGLGVGTLACYRRPGQRWTFYEIDPEVLGYSQRHIFTFLDRCAGDAPVVIGDARLELAKAAPDSFDILAIDAFSSDAIPLHLLTEEAQEVYFRALAPDGLLLVHISNRFVELETVLAALAQKHGLSAAVRIDDPAAGWPQTASHWAVLTRSPAKLAALTGGNDAWRPLEEPATSVWTDDFASIIPHLKWNRFL